MKFKQIFNTIILTISLGITGYSYLKSQNQLPLNFTPTTKSIDDSPLVTSPDVDATHTTRASPNPLGQRELPWRYY